MALVIGQGSEKQKNFFNSVIRLYLRRSAVPAFIFSEMAEQTYYINALYFGR